MHLRFLWGFVALAVALPHDQSPAIEPLHSFNRRALPVGTCNSDTPCENGACCGSNNLCGYSPTECGTGCASNCDAKAECGEYGAAGSQNCPLDVCCSKFGFCGSTDDFCGDGCQTGYGGCGPVPAPSCSGSMVGRRTIGYYESWASTRPCQAVTPEELNLSGFTHINFAFAYFDPNSYQIAPMDENSAGLYSRFTALKNNNPGLQTWISVGGWSFTDPGPTREAFSNMAASASSRQQFITGLLQFMNQYGFDGVDLDWEYPQADDRGGQTADTANYVTLASELKAQLGSKGLSMTLPTSYWYLRHFDVKSLEQSVDWFNFMAYDLHGVWDASSQFVGPYIAPHTNLTEIDLGLDLLWRAGVSADKVVLGQGWYGRSFTLADPSCNTPNGVCQFTGGANAGPCSATSGILDDQEIQNIISQTGVTPVWDHTAGVKWITWDNNQWVSYDDADTFQQKKDFAQSRCLGGLMVWAMDQMDQTMSNGLGSSPNVTPGQQSNAMQMSSDMQAKSSCYVTDCNVSCKKGTNKVQEVFGQPGQISTRDRCPSKQYRSVCCDDGTLMGKCQWRGYRGAGMSCISGCADGETEVITDTDVLNGKKEQSCAGGLQSYCCAGFKPPPSKAQLEQDAEDAAKDAAEQAAEQAALDVAAKAFCRIAVPALLAPLEALEDLIPIIGEIADLIEIAATPAIIEGCVKGIEKEGSAEFKVFGKKHTLSLDMPEKPPETRPPESSHKPESTSDNSCHTKRMDANDPCLRDRRTVCNNPIRTYHPGVNRYCDYDVYPQACAHYASVIARGARGFLRDRVAPLNPLTCPLTSFANYRARDEVAITKLWYDGHNEGWIDGWMQAPNLHCQADEYPPAAFWQNDDQAANQQYIRYIQGTQNMAAGSDLFGLDLCQEHYEFAEAGQGRVKTTTGAVAFHDIVNEAGRAVAIYTADCSVTLSTVNLAFRGQQYLNGFGEVANQCWPSTLINDPGFAMVTWDQWYTYTQDLQIFDSVREGLYLEEPGPDYTNNKQNNPGWNRRRFAPPDLHDLTWHDDGNSTHRMSDEEVAARLGIAECLEAGCEYEKAWVEEYTRRTSLPSAPRETTAEATGTADGSSKETGYGTGKAVAGSNAHGLLSASLPTATATSD